MKALVKPQVQASSQFLTFLLDEQEYGLELFKIQEIRGYAPVTPIPNVPAHVRGVMNLRGTVLPVVDLRMKFRLPPIEYNKFTVIVIAMVGDKMVGLLVDACRSRRRRCARLRILGRPSIRASLMASFRPASISPWRSTWRGC
jgi:chemotaxis signal transduction protein